MENVTAFNTELSGLYDSKPPISKAKMAAITKSAMRAIKFYKHVVQSVEKFILKCRAEYKVPGLYVIDSIVRQSRHQFGPEKDVFAPRFARNIKETFANLFRCAPEDKSRIIRVLNLWQKNNVFAPDVIQPLFDLADPNHPIYQTSAAGNNNALGGSGGGPLSLGDISSTSNGLNASGLDMSLNSLPSGPDDKMMPDLSSMSHEKAQNVLDTSSLRQLEHMQHYLKRQTAAGTVATTSTSATGAPPTASKPSSSTSASYRTDHHAHHHATYPCCGPSEDAMGDSSGAGGSGGGGVPACCGLFSGSDGGGGGPGNCCAGCCPTSKHQHRHHSASAAKYSKSSDISRQHHSHPHGHSHPHAHPPQSSMHSHHSHSHTHSHHRSSAVERDHRGVAATGAAASCGAATDDASDSDHDRCGGADGDDDDDDDVVEASSPPPPPPPPPPLPQHAGSSANFLDNNNLKQLLNDPNVLMQLKTLQSFQKFKQQDKTSDMRLQEEAFEKHLHIMMKAGGVQTSGVGQDSNSFDVKEVEFVSEEQKIEVINLDGNDSRSPSPDRDRYKRRRSSRSRSRSRDRGRGSDRRRGRSRSRSRSRSPRSSQRRRGSRDRDRNKEKDREHDRERRKKGLPDIRKEHLSVCSTTLWVGHLSKLVYQEELSDTFGEYGDIVSIDQIVPRGCAFIVMNRRQDAYKAMQALKNCKLQGRAITISWAAGKGVKSKEWKDFWDLELGVTYVPWNKLDTNTDLDSLEEGGMFDEDSMPGWMKDKISQLKNAKEKAKEMTSAAAMVNVAAMPPQPTPNMLFGIDTTQPPPGPPHGAPPPPMMQMVPGQFPMAPPMGPRMLGGPMGMQLSGIPMPPNMVPGMPPPHMMMPAGMMPPGFPPMPGPGGPMGPPPMGLPPGQYPPPGPVGAPPAASVAVAPPFPSASHPPSDDQMDIEMDEDDAPAAASLPQQPPSMNFNQPPPPMMFGGAGNNGPPVGAGPGEPPLGGDIFSRDRNRSGAGPAVGGPGGNSRWGGRGADDADAQEGRWRENGTGGGAGLANFNGRPGGPMNIPPLDLNSQDLINEFDNRGGPRGGGGNAVGAGGPRGGNADFFQNTPNRFNQPTSLMQMRIPPPNSFGGPGGRGGGGGAGGPGGMFMRGQGPNAGRQGQSGQGFFNSRNPFDRDGGGGRGARGGGRGARGGRGVGAIGAAGGQGNWSDDDDQDGRGDGFKRRGGAGGGGGRNNSRFRDREDADDWHGGGGNRERGAGGALRGRHGRDREPDFRGGSRERRRNSPGAGNSTPQTTAIAAADEADTWAEKEGDNNNDNSQQQPQGGGGAPTGGSPPLRADTDSLNTAANEAPAPEESAQELPSADKKKHNNPFAVAKPAIFSERPQQLPQPPLREESPLEAAAPSEAPEKEQTTPAAPPPPSQPQQQEETVAVIAAPAVVVAAEEPARVAEAPVDPPTPVQPEAQIAAEPEAAPAVATAADEPQEGA